ncbi:uncharacterized protein LOC112092314 [Morus notabilis]|uniref:uncharacterized protein LOC112092314 n=1 Tax=Morus notabilis TaxID=981085 RepID=UPI000CECFF50|nr:uncharacterized protein LOC112092314 [Morus notabilis]
MVASRAEKMEGRVEMVEKDIGELKGAVGQLSVDMGAVKDYMKEITDWMRSGNGVNSSAEHAGAFASNEVEGGGATAAAVRRRRQSIPIKVRHRSAGNLGFAEWKFLFSMARIRSVGCSVWNGTFRSGHISWLRFKELVIQRFRSSQTGNHYESLIALRQESTVADLWEKFELLSSPLREADEEFLVGAFSNGLAEEIRAEVRMVKPVSLIQLMDLAQNIEEKNWALERAYMKRTYRPNLGKDSNRVLEGRGFSFSGDYGGLRGAVTGRTFPVSGASELPTKPIEGGGATVTRSNSFQSNMSVNKEHLRVPSQPARRNENFKRRISDAEMQRRRERVLIAAEDEEEEEVAAEDTSTPRTQEEGSLELSMNSIVGIPSINTMKVKGTILNKEVVILIDSGASHNFISRGMVEELKLPIDGTPSFRIMVGNGYKVAGQVVCRQVEVSLQGLHIIQDFFSIELGSADVILCITWLGMLGEVSANWKKLTMQFDWQCKRVLLQGDPSLFKTLVSLKAMLKAIQEEGQRFLVEFGQVTLLDQSVGVVEDDALEGLLTEFNSVFEPPAGLPPSRFHDHAIPLKEGTDPPNLRPYRFPHSQKNEIERIVREMMAAGIIKHSNSPFLSPVLLVKKKTGEWRFCMDYRALNKITIPDRFPIPAIDELLDELGGAVFFSKLDLKSGYHQIRVREEDTPKTAFRTHAGHYEFLVMPFGLTNAPQHQLVANRKKCVFGQPQVEYLGHIITDSGVQADPEKIAAMVDWPVPKSIRDLRGFLGLTGYYRHFVRDYGKIAEPLTRLLKKDAFLWTSDAQGAFEELKQRMVSVPVLALPDFTKTFIIETDASGRGLGAVLMQDNRPIAFINQSLSDRARSRSVYERELMAVVLATKKWRHYLLGRHFIVRTDQRSLRFLLEQQIMNEAQQRWICKLIGLDFEIHYKPGRDNRVADALSRRHEEPLL